MKQFIIFRWFNNISISKKMYLVVGILGLFIAVELSLFWFSLNTLSSIRAMVSGEGLWSKAQKDAFYSIRRYALTGDEKDFQAFFDYMKVPLGDKKARIELEKENPDFKIARHGILEGRNHPDDVDGIMQVFIRFRKISYMDKAISFWAKGDSLNEKMTLLVGSLKQEITSPLPSQDKIGKTLSDIGAINSALIKLENNFSSVLGEGSRWIEKLAMRILLAISLMMGFLTLILFSSVSRKIAKGINELKRVTNEVAKGNFSNKATIYSKDEIGSFAGSFNIMIDELDKNEKTIQESEKRFSTIFDRNPVAMTLSDMKYGKIAYANNLFCSTFGYTREEVIEHTSKELKLTSPEEDARLLPFILESLKEEIAGRSIEELQSISNEETEKLLNKLKQDDAWKNFEVQYTRKNGNTFPALVSFEVIDSDDKKFIVTSYQDITERKRAEEATIQKTEELKRSNNELEQFAYVASHDLQEPVRIITSYVQLIEKRYKDKLDKDADEYINFTVDAAKRMGILINDLLAYSRVGAVKSGDTKTDCNAILKIVINLLQSSIIETEAKIIIDALPQINCNEIQITQLFQNIIGNAIKFRGEKKPEIIITAKNKTSHWLFSVSDNGIGIKNEYLEKIFVIFQRLHSKEAYPGTGIGLSICKKIVEQHGGTIWAESEFGKGTTFYFTIRKKMEHR